MKIIDVIVLLICLSIVLSVTYASRKKAKKQKIEGNYCSGSCGGCSGCSSIKTYLKEKQGAVTKR